MQDSAENERCTHFGRSHNATHSALFAFGEGTEIVRAAPKIRPLTPNDANDIARVLGLSHGLPVPTVARWHAPNRDRVLVEERPFGSADVFGAFSGDHLIGYITWRPQWIDHLYVMPEHTEAGVGTALLDAVKARQKRIDLWTLENNTHARKFYEARGFVEIELTNGAGRAEQEPDVLYRWLRP